MNVTRSGWFHLLALVLLVLLLSGACGDDENRFLVSIQLSPTSATIDDVPPNNTVQFLATGFFSKGPNADLTSTATWSSSQVAVATVSSSGLVTAVPGACDSTVIRAVQDNIVATATVSVC
jgi:hypothetical protein